MNRQEQISINYMLDSLIQVLCKSKAIRSIPLSVLTLIITSPAFAAPVISSMSKTPNTIIIYGSNFGTKPNAAPIRFETFSGANGTKVTTKGWWTTKDGNPNYSPPIKTGVSRVPGRNVVDLSLDSNTALSLFRNGVGFKSTRKAYVNWWAYLDFSGFDGVPVQIKLLNLNRNTKTTSDNEYPDQATSLWIDMNSTTSGTLSRYYYGTGSAPSLSYKNGEGTNLDIFKTPGWYNFAIQLDQGTLGIADGKATIWLSGPRYSKYGVTTDATFVKQIDGGDYIDSIKLWQYLQFRTSFTSFSGFQGAYSAGYPVGARVNYTGDGIFVNQKGYRCILATGPKADITLGPDVDTRHWVKISDKPLIISDTLYVDSLYIDNSFARVEVCDTPTWSTRTHCEIQPATAWSDGQIMINFNPGSFTSGQSLYVYVADSNGVINSDGYKFTIGALPVSAPKNVTVTPIK